MAQDLRRKSSFFPVNGTIMIEWRCELIYHKNDKRESVEIRDGSVWNSGRHSKETDPL